MPALTYMDEEKRGGRKGVNWLAVRTYYLSSSAVTYADCSRKFGVSTRSIETRGSKEGWKDERARIFGQAEGQLRQRAIEDRVSGLAAHVDRADALVALSAQLEAELLSDTKASSRSKIEAYKSLVEATDKATRLARAVRGIRDGEASESGSAEDTKWVIEHRELEPKKIAVNDQGRAVGE